MHTTRRHFLAASAVTIASTALGQSTSRPAPPATTAATRPDLTWTDALSLTLDARPYTDTLSPYDRLPARAKSIVRPPVWSLSRNSAGLAVRFTSDAPTISVRYALTSDKIAMPHMPATGVSGVDLYAFHNNRWTWLAVSRPASQDVDTQLITDVPAGTRAYTLYLPLYNGVKNLEIGVPTRSAIAPWPRASKSKSILYYGTSIAQGACASRPGLAFTNILSRRLDRTIFNEAFSGNGRMDPELAPMFAELDVAAFVLDTLPNMTPEQVKERAEPFVRDLRKVHAETPILLVEDRTFSSAPLQPKMRQLHTERRANLRAAFDRLKKDDANLHYLEGESILGEDTEATTDGSHPNDLGMMRYADALEPVLRRILS